MIATASKSNEFEIIDSVVQRQPRPPLSSSNAASKPYPYGVKFFVRQKSQREPTFPNENLQEDVPRSPLLTFVTTTTTISS